MVEPRYSYVDNPTPAWANAYGYYARLYPHRFELYDDLVNHDGFLCAVQAWCEREFGKPGEIDFEAPPDPGDGRWVENNFGAIVMIASEIDALQFRLRWC